MNLDTKIEPQYVGQLLLQRGFKDFMLYLFRCIEGRPFIVEPIHNEMFKTFEDIYNQKINRININLPPRCGKTVFCKYFVVYCITKNPRCNFIYTSYSQILLKDIAREIQAILENNIYKELFPVANTYSEEELNPIDDYWKELIYKETKGQKTTYSSNKIVTAQGGILLFTAIGTTLTGFGAGIRGINGFTGGIIIDDGNKPADIRSQVKTQNVMRYYSETLLSRLNNRNGLICNVQQRLGLNDLTAFLEEKYNFQTLKKPLVDDNGVCLLPMQYKEKDLLELQRDNYLWQTQYLQNAIFRGGNIIKGDWFKYYSINTKYNYKKIVISADTAIQVKEANDFTCFLVGGVTLNNQLHILDIVHGKWEYPELKQTAINLYNKWQFSKRETSASAVCIENKASGQQLIQDFKKVGLPVKAIEVTKDKLTRVEEVLEFIASGNVLLPENRNYGNNNELISECEEFTRDNSHTHDDCVDSLTMLINNTIAKKQVSILEVL